jgi:phosphomevalonate kinase
MSAFRLSVPGNLLLAGEYAVLEEGGLGAAVAVEPRLTVTVFPADRWEIAGRWTGGGERWSPESGVEPTFAGLVFFRALELLEGRGDERSRRWSTRTRPARIEVDSTGFFDAQGRKRGFGSSAALAAGLTAALARLAGRAAGAELALTAILAHRHAQGGRGSGYDVNASWFGGFGLFFGGETPRWEPADAQTLPSLAVFSGPEAVRTVGSIARYREWKARDPGAARDFFDASNAAVRALASAAGAEAWLEAWARCRELGVDLGEKIGSPAGLAVPEGLPEGAFVKALGAGNETGAAAFRCPVGPGDLPEGLVNLTVAPEGLRWE